MALWHWHKWGQWKDAEAVMTNMFTGTRREGLIQTRRCASCGKLEVRHI